VSGGSPSAIGIMKGGRLCLKRPAKVHCLVHIPERLCLIRASGPWLKEAGGAIGAAHFRLAVPLSFYSRDMKSCSTYQNMSATEENSASAAPTCRSAG